MSGCYPELTPQSEINRLALEIVQKSQIIEKNYIGRDFVDIETHSSEPLMLVCGSDLHIMSLATNHQSVIDLFDFVMSTKNAKLILLGDEIEGLTDKYMNTNTARTVVDVHKQLDIFGEMLRPLVEADKVAAMVSGYWGHNGWVEDSSTLNPWIMLAKEVGFDRRRIMRNGGRVNFVFPNGYVHSETIWHNPTGKSKYDSVYGLRNVALATSESSRTDGYMSGHIHRMGVGKELFSGANSAVYFISSGTAKGSSKETPPDRFGVKLGAQLTDPLGQGVIIEPGRRSHTEKFYPFASLEQGKVANEALDLLNWVEKKGMTAELLEKIRTEVEKKPKITLVSGRSRVSGDEKTEEKPMEAVKVGGELVTNPYSNMTMRAPYDALTYNIETRLPVTLHLLSNARLGSSSEGFDDLKRYQQEQIASNPHSLVVFLRNMIDQEAGKSSKRMEILDRFKEVINGSREQTLAIMMCKSLRSSDWKKKVKTGEEYVDINGIVHEFDELDDLFDDEGKKMKVKKRTLYSMPIAPGSYLANETDTPLIRNLSLINLIIGPKGVIKEKPIYSGVFVDKEMKHASFSRPEYGLRRMYDLYIHEKPGFVAGGHMQNAGAMTFYDGSNAETKTPILIAPGWFAKYSDQNGPGNEMPGAEPGQAIIFMPGRYMAYPTVNADETGYMQDAFTLKEGLRLLGITNKVLGRRR